MVPSNILRHPTESPGLFSRPRNTLHCQQSLSTDQGKCHPMQSQTSLIDHISQMHHPQPFDLPGWLNCPFMRGSTNLSFIMGIDYQLFVLHCACSISPHNSESHIDGLVPTHRAQIQHEPLHPLVFRSLECSTFFREGCWAELGNKHRLFAFTAPWCSMRGSRGY